MKILCISNADNGGNAYFTAEAVNRYTEHEARAVRLMQNWIAYPYDLLNPGNAEIARLVRWADVVHGRDHYPEGIPSSKPVVMTYSGMSFRLKPGKFATVCRQRGWLLTVSTIDLTRVRLDEPPLWIPNPREEMEAPRDRMRRSFTYAHAPTMRHRKGTEIVEAAAEMIEVALEVIERTPYAECLARKARCHALVDQFTYCYGNNATEMWAMGKPVISNASEKAWMDAILEVNDREVPFLRAEPEVSDLAEKMALLRDSKKARRLWIERGRDYFFRFHHAPKVAERAIEMYERAREMKA